MDDTLPLRFDPHGSVVGLSGLSDKMRTNPDDCLGLDDTQQMNIAIASLAPEGDDSDSQVRVGDVPNEFRMVMRPTGSTRYRSLYIAIGLLTAFVAIIGATIIYATRVMPENYEGSIEGDTEAIHVTPGDNLAVSTPLQTRVTHKSWKLVGEQYKYNSRKPSALVRVVNTRKVQDRKGNWWYEAQLTTRETDVIAFATVHISLIDLSAIENFNISFPVSMISARTPVNLRIPMPNLEGIDKQRVDAWVEVDRKYDHAQYVRPDQITATPAGESHDSRLRIITYNKTDRDLRYIIYRINAIDEGGAVIASWATIWDHRVPAQNLVRFVTMTPLPKDKNVARWDIVAAAE
ncbi:hypothetical protein [Poriferisphaera corsica]|nr:hypothetical protein [Poriferisphaera corsica]